MMIITGGGIHIIVDATVTTIIDPVATIMTPMTVMIIPIGTTHVITTTIVKILEASNARFLKLRKFLLWTV